MSNLASLGQVQDRIDAAALTAIFAAAVSNPSLPAPSGKAADFRLTGWRTAAIRPPIGRDMRTREQGGSP